MLREASSVLSATQWMTHMPLPPRRGPAVILFTSRRLVAIVSHNSFVVLVFLVSHNYRAICCKTGDRHIAQMCMCKAKYQGGIAPFWGSAAEIADQYSRAKRSSSRENNGWLRVPPSNLWMRPCCARHPHPTSRDIGQTSIFQIRTNYESQGHFWMAMNAKHWDSSTIPESSARLG